MSIFPRSRNSGVSARQAEEVQRQTRIFDLSVAAKPRKVPSPTPFIEMIFARHACFQVELVAAMIVSSRNRWAAVAMDVFTDCMTNRGTSRHGSDSGNGLFGLDLLSWH